MRSLLAVIFALWSGVVSAQWYAGGALGQGQISLPDDILPIIGAPATNLSKDETDAVFKGFAGFRINRNFAVEGGYADLGSYAATRTVLAVPAGSFSASIKSSGFFADVLGILPTGGAEIFGKVGFIRTTTKLSVSTTGAVILLSEGNAEVTEWNPRVGVGVQFPLGPKAAIRAEYEKIMDVGDRNKTGEGDVSITSIGAVFNF